MKKTVFLCLLLVMTLSLSGCVTLRFYQGDPLVQVPNGLQATPGVTDATDLQSDPSNAANWSKEEIVARFCDAVNLSKGNTLNYTLQKGVKHEVAFLGTADGQMPRMAESVVKKLNRNESHSYTVTGGAAVTETGNIPATELIAPKGMQFALQDAQITAAQASFDGTNVIAVISLCDDTANAQQPIPAIHGELISYLSFRGQDLSPYSVQTAQLEYTDVSLAASIDSAGRLVTMSITANVTGSGVGAFTVLTTEALFTAKVKESYAFSYS